jgi:1-acyl-sn-glycerol-3-phosphate acyltransferase
VSRIIYYFYLIQALPLQAFVFKTKSYYEDDRRQNKRIKGGAIIISNHRSGFDGLVIVLRFFFKRLHFIATDFYKHRLKIVKFMLHVAGGIFVDSELNRFDFIEKSKRIIAKGRSIMIFPEGGFKHTYEPSKFFVGYIMLAIKTGAKIIPVVNDFNYGLFKRVHLMIGNSIDLSGY